MGLDFFRRSVELVDRYLQPGRQAAYTIQTNGTKLDEDWAAFLKEHDFLVGISIDGPREIHDAFRLTRGGRGSFEQVMRGLGHLRAGGVQDNVLTTVHAANEHRGIEVYPVPARRVRRAVHAVHPGDRARGRSQRQWRAALVIVA